MEAYTNIRAYRTQYQLDSRVHIEEWTETNLVASFSEGGISKSNVISIC